MQLHLTRERYFEDYTERKIIPSVKILNNYKNVLSGISQPKKELNLTK